MLDKGAYACDIVLVMIFYRRTPMTLVRWNPARELASMEIDRLNHMLNDFYGNGPSWTPAVDVFETNAREFIVKAELPEVKRDDINVTFENGVLTLTLPKSEAAKPRQIKVGGASQAQVGNGSGGSSSQK